MAFKDHVQKLKEQFDRFQVELDVENHNQCAPKPVRLEVTGATGVSQPKSLATVSPLSRLFTQVQVRINILI